MQSAKSSEEGWSGLFESLQDKSFPSRAISSDTLDDVDSTFLFDRSSPIWNGGRTNPRPSYNVSHSERCLQAVDGGLFRRLFPPSLFSNFTIGTTVGTCILLQPSSRSTDYTLLPVCSACFVHCRFSCDHSPSFSMYRRFL
jgi:hypothetical protein